MGPVPLAPNFHLVHDASDQDIAPCKKVCVWGRGEGGGDMLVNALVHGSDMIFGSRLVIVIKSLVFKQMAPSIHRIYSIPVVQCILRFLIYINQTWNSHNLEGGICALYLAVYCK